MTDVAAICAEIEYSICYVIKKDGTLWESEMENFLRDGEAPTKLLDDVKSVRIADNSVRIAYDHVSTARQAVKTDGTLWQWGVTYQYDEELENLVMIAEIKTPAQVTEGAAEIIAGFKEGVPTGQFVSTLTDEKIVEWEKEHGKLAGIADSGYDDFLVLAEDGTLWAYGRNGGDPGVDHTSQPVLTDVRLPGATPSAPAGSASPAAKPTASTVLVDGESVAFDAYNINDNNYFKLRDIAYVLSGTEKQFEVGWDGTANAISLTSGKAYTPVGGEMEGKGAGDKTAAPTTSKITLDGEEVSLTAYNIGGNNYFKLRDIGAAFDFGVSWDGAKNTIVIDTSKGYTPE
ncbi:MAG: hypothetical protein LBD49_00815 [Oscillospiraceae bacterium]|nr:hypothetical protein [Oscillospiraceae bacterium]